MKRASTPMPRLFCLLALTVSMLTSQTSAEEDKVTVFAAASLTNAVTKATQRFEQQTGTKIRLSFAGSSTLARQIEAGADVDVFLSANEGWADYLLDRGLLDPDRQSRSLTNKLVLVAPAINGQKALPELHKEELLAILGSEGLIAMGDPDHVPVGIYGKEALSALGLWTTLRTRLARTDNVRAALALVSRAEVPLAIVYESDTVGMSDLTTLYTFEQGPTPIRYVFAMSAGQHSAAATDLYSFLNGKEGTKIFEQFGFSKETAK
nr:molybdate ABC transporter substrate-binding protein [uncultured Cohaesibacter sp.]